MTGQRRSKSSIERTTWWNNYTARIRRGEEYCRECGATNNLTFDHIQPHSLGGRYTFDNVTILCEPCNTARGASVAEAHVRSLAQEEVDAPPERQWSRHPLDPDSPRGKRYAQREGEVAVYLDEGQHGTRSAFYRHGCRCPKCQAWKEARNERKADNKRLRAPLSHNPFSELGQVGIHD